MVYRMTVRSNPRILAVYIILPLIVGAGAVAPFVLGVLFGLVALAAALFFVWQLLKLTRRQLATRIETLTDEVVFNLHGDEKISFPWDKIRIAGLALQTDVADTRRRNNRRLFIYNEETDRMFVVTDEFESLDRLAAELREKTDFRELELSPGETLKERLRELVGRPKNGDNG